MERLMEASRAGNIDGLYAAIRENANILAQIDAVPFVDTPLHAAASAGHIQYAMEIMRLMPSFATKSDQDGFCPIHLALRSGHIQLVIRLVERDTDLVRLKGREAITPLHYVAEQGNLDLLARFLLVCPKSIEDVTIRNETVLHIALRNNMFEAFEFLVGRLHWDCHEEGRYWEKRILNWKDETGNTVLHIVTSKNQPQVVRLLIGDVRCFPSFLIIREILSNFFPFICGIEVDLKIKNSEGLTAVDILQEEGQLDIGLFEATRALAKFNGLSDGPDATGVVDYLRREILSCRKWYIGVYRDNVLMPDGNRNAVLVVAVLITTATYQAVLSPPGGLWQADPTLISSDSSHINATANSTNIHKLEPMPGTSVLECNDWTGFSILNSWAFYTAILKINNIFPGGPYSILPLTLPLVLCYTLSMIFTSPCGVGNLLWLIAPATSVVYFKCIFEGGLIRRKLTTVKRLLLNTQHQTMQNET
ncbi:hypothetical protein P3X46_025546 [Hevea brasiliensis]|uniref:PGG domain-containing protein n=1 Tax=Hevea brasiliensis TaxID=3981 RepID=A0ABQ9L7N6_HEVBR|nr:hypothetical protein P3X46_025546 [Hevea brasiliensis]